MIGTDEKMALTSHAKAVRARSLSRRPPVKTQSKAPRNREAERRALHLMQVAIFVWYGETCSCCGTAENLSVDHTAGDGPEHRTEVYGRPGTRGYNPAKLYRWIIEHGFPVGFGTMCRPCNWSKRDGDHCRLYHGQLAEYEKWCGSCERIRDRRTDFGSDARRADKLSDTCRECARRHQADWRERHGTHRSVSTREGTIGGRILAYLGEHGASSTADLAGFLGITPAAASVNLGGLVQAGHIRRPARGMFCLPGREGEMTEVRRVYARGPDWEARHAGSETAGHDWAAGMTWTTQQE